MRVTFPVKNIAASWRTPRLISRIDLENFFSIPSLHMMEVRLNFDRMFCFVITLNPN